MSQEKRSYREEQQRWGITTALQMLMYFKYNGYETLTYEHVWDIARVFQVEEDLKGRLSVLEERAENCKECEADNG